MAVIAHSVSGPSSPTGRSFYGSDARDIEPAAHRVLKQWIEYRAIAAAYPLVFVSRDDTDDCRDMSRVLVSVVCNVRH